MRRGGPVGVGLTPDSGTTRQGGRAARCLEISGTVRQLKKRDLQVDELSGAGDAFRIASAIRSLTYITRSPAAASASGGWRVRTQLTNASISSRKGSPSAISIRSAEITG